MAYGTGLIGPYQYDGAIAPGFLPAAMLFYVNRIPLVTRLPNVGINGDQVKAVDDQYKPKSQAVVDNPLTNVATTLTIADSGSYNVGDIIEIESEQVQVTAIASPTTVTITRGVNGSSAAQHSAAVLAYLVGNTRTGSEVDVSANIRPFDLNITYPQTVMEAYQVGGSTESSSPNMAIPMGFASFLGYQRAKAAQECLFGIERSIYYGRANPLASATTRPMMQGVRNRISTNKVTNPTNASTYKPSDFVRDVITPGVAGGGMVDAVVCSEEYRVGFATWGLNMTLLQPGNTEMGLNIETFVVSGIQAKIVFAPLLRPYTAFGLTSSEVYMGWKRYPFDKPRGSRGDAWEGDMIAEGTVVLNNEAHHTWVEGVTGWAKQS